MAQVEGLKSLQQKLRAKRDAHMKAVRRGLLKAGLFLQRKSQQVVPIDTGALRNSAFTRAGGTETNPEVRVGYTQAYAIYVHERQDLRHAKGKSAKYLEGPARQYRQEIVDIVLGEVKGATS